MIGKRTESKPDFQIAIGVNQYQWAHGTGGGYYTVTYRTFQCQLCGYKWEENDGGWANGSDAPKSCKNKNGKVLTCQLEEHVHAGTTTLGGFCHSTTTTFVMPQRDVTLTANGGIDIPTQAIYRYPNIGTFSALNNRGTLSATISDSTIANVSTSGNNVSVEPIVNWNGTDTEKTTTLTVTSETESGEISTKTQNVTIQKGVINVTGCDVVWSDAAETKRTVKVNYQPSDATIKYCKTANGTYANSIEYTDAGIATFYYKITKDGYITEAGSYTVTMNGVPNVLELDSYGGELEKKDGVTSTIKFNIITNKSGGSLSVSSPDETVAKVSRNGNVVTVTGVGSWTDSASEKTIPISVSSGPKGHYNAKTVYYNIKVRRVINVTKETTYNGKYDTKAHTIAVTYKPTDAVISYGVSTKANTKPSSYNLLSPPSYTEAGTYYVWYKITKSSYATLEKELPIVIEKAAGTLTLSATSGTITVPNAKTKTFTASKNTGSLSVSSSDESVATASVSGQTVTITAVGNWSGTTASQKATITVTSAQSDNYAEISKTYTVTITKTAGKLTLQSTSGTCTSPNESKIKITAHLGGNISVSSNDTSIARARIDGDYLVITPVSAGKTTITLTSAATNEYTEKSATYTVTVK